MRVRSRLTFERVSLAAALQAESRGLPPALKLNRCRYTETALVCEWADGHVGRVPIDAVEGAFDVHRFCASWLATKPKICAWNGDRLPFDAANAFEFESLNGGDQQTNSLKHALQTFGWVRVGGCSSALCGTATANVVDSFLREFAALALINTPLGAVFTCRNEGHRAFAGVAAPNADKLLAAAIPFGTDFAFLPDPPAFAVTLCEENTVIGGELLLVDGWTLVRENLSPNELRALSDTRIDYRAQIVRRAGGTRGAFVASHALLEVGADGSDEQMHIVYSPSYARRIHAPFPQCRSFYDALQTFEDALALPANSLEIRLQPGDMLICDNRRILRCTKSFEKASGNRHIKTFYARNTHADALWR